eukprot:NODE_7_length_48057_cov_0.322240.p20 type:complete len:214 gc:universal NODE_7_length_48057_cov_0.322240:9613-8972(-)
MNYEYEHMLPSQNLLHLANNFSIYLPFNYKAFMSWCQGVKKTNYFIVKASCNEAFSRNIDPRGVTFPDKYNEAAHLFFNHFDLKLKDIEENFFSGKDITHHYTNAISAGILTPDDLRDHGLEWIEEYDLNLKDFYRSAEEFQSTITRIGDPEKLIYTWCYWFKQQSTSFEDFRHICDQLFSDFSKTDLQEMTLSDLHEFTKIMKSGEKETDIG